MKNLIFSCDAIMITRCLLLPSIFLTSCFVTTSHQSKNYTVRITIQHNSILHIAEVEFFLKNNMLGRSNFLFTATSYANSILFGDNRETGPPQAANDGKKETFYHNGLIDDSQVGCTGRCCPDLKPALIIFSVVNVSFDRIIVTNRQDLDGDNNNYFSRLVGATITIDDPEGNILYEHKFKTPSSSYSFVIQQRDISFQDNSVPPHKQIMDGGLFYGKMTPFSNELSPTINQESSVELHVWARCDLTNGFLHGQLFLDGLNNASTAYIYWSNNNKKKVSVFINGTLSSRSFSGDYGSGSFTYRLDIVDSVASTIRIEVPGWSPHLDYPTQLCKNACLSESKTNNHGCISSDSESLSKYIRSAVLLLSLDYNSSTDIDAFLAAHHNIGPPEHCGLLREGEEKQKEAIDNKNPVNIFMIGDSIDRNMVEDLCRRTAGSQVFESWADLQYNKWHAASICCVATTFTLGAVHVFGSPPKGPYMHFPEGPLVDTDRRIEYSFKEYVLQFGEPDFILFRSDL
jgi:hypothetical protein